MKFGKILCWLGIHQIRKGFGWFDNNRIDICLKKECRWNRRVHDPVGRKELDKMIKGDKL